MLWEQESGIPLVSEYIDLCCTCRKCDGHVTIEPTICPVFQDTSHHRVKGKLQIFLFLSQLCVGEREGGRGGGDKRDGR